MVASLQLRWSKPFTDDKFQPTAQAPAWALFLWEELVDDDVTEGIVIGVFTAVLVLAVAGLIYLLMWV